MADSSRASPKKVPRWTAIIDRDACTGCEACVAVCPVDCIVKCYPPGDRSGLMSWCEIDTDRC
ncbi:MAG: electron transporter RnfB, partial [Planctomycetota bacterium]